MNLVDKKVSDSKGKTYQEIISFRDISPWLKEYSLERSPSRKIGLNLLQFHKCMKSGFGCKGKSLLAMFPTEYEQRYQENERFTQNSSTNRKLKTN